MAPIPLERPVDFVARTYSRLTVILLVPVSITIWAVVWAVHNLTPLYGGGNESPLFLVKDENTATTSAGKFTDSLINALVIVAVICVLTFLILLLYKCGCGKLLIGWFVITAIVVNFFILWVWIDLVFTRFQIPYDFITLSLFLWNFGIVGLVSLFYHASKKFEQVYLLVFSVVIGWVMTRLPEWSTWTILVLVAIYDIVAVLCPGGPLRLLVEEAHKRKDPIPGFVYDSNYSHAVLERQTTRDNDESSYQTASSPLLETEEKTTPDSAAPSIAIPVRPPQDNDANNIMTTTSKGNPFIIEEKDGNSKKCDATPTAATSSDSEDEDPFESAEHANSFKLGLGDFIFYSLLCGRAATRSYVAWNCCYISVSMGLLGTLCSLLFLRGKIPAVARFAYIHTAWYSNKFYSTVCDE